MAESSIHELILQLKLIDSQFHKALGKSVEDIAKFDKQLKVTEETAKSFKSLAISGAVFGGIGFGIAEGLKSMMEPAIKFAEAQTQLQIATGATNEELDRFARQAHELSNVLPESAEEITALQASLAKMLGSTSAALETTKIATQFAAATHMSAAAAGELLGSAYQTMGDKGKSLIGGFQEIADTLTKLTTAFPGAAGGSEELARSFAHAAIAARTFHIPMEQLGGLLGMTNRMGLGGSRGAGPMVEELIATLGKLDKYRMPEMNHFGNLYVPNAQGGLDLLKTLDRIRNMAPAMLSAYEKSLGTQGFMLQTLIEHYNDLKDATAAFGNVAGATGDAAAKAADTPAAKLKIFADNVDNLKEALGTAMLPALIKITQALEPVMQGLAAFAEAHPTIIVIAGALAGTAAAALMVIGPLLMTVAVIKEIRTWTLVATAALKVFRGIMIGLEALMALNPIGLVIIAAAALAAVAYEVYEHWAAVKKFFTEGWGRFTPFGDVLRDVLLLIDILPKIYHWGVHLVDNFVAGIKAGFSKIHEAMHQLGQIIKSYLPFSPAETGPLRDLNRVRIVETIAETMKPMPLLNAMRKVLLAAVSAPLMLAPAFANSPSFAQPLMWRAGISAGASGGMSVDGGIHFHLNVTAPSGASGMDVADSILKAMKSQQDKFADEIERLMDRVDRRRNRKDHWQ